MHWLKPGQAVTLAYTMPIWACFLGWPLLGQRPTRRQFGAVLMGLLGVIILVGIDNVAFRSDDAAGIALALSAAVLFAFSTVFSKRSPLPMPPIALTGWQVGLGSIPLLIAGLMFEDANFTKLSLIAWSALVYTTIVSMGLCYLTWFIAVKRLSVTGAAIGTLLTPVIGVSASSLVLGDPLTSGQLISLALVAGGIMLSVRDAGVPSR